MRRGARPGGRDTRGRDTPPRPRPPGSTGCGYSRRIRPLRALRSSRSPGRGLLRLLRRERRETAPLDPRQASIRTPVPHVLAHLQQVLPELRVIADAALREILLGLLGEQVPHLRGPRDRLLVPPPPPLPEANLALLATQTGGPFRKGPEPGTTL